MRRQSLMRQKKFSIFVLPSIEAFGTIGFLDGAAAVRDDRQSAFVLDLLAYFFVVVGLIGRDRQW